MEKKEMSNDDEQRMLCRQNFKKNDRRSENGPRIIYAWKARESASKRSAEVTIEDIQVSLRT
jgi:hypothetical protein